MIGGGFVPQDQIFCCFQRVSQLWITEIIKWEEELLSVQHYQSAQLCASIYTTMSTQINLKCFSACLAISAVLPLFSSLNNVILQNSCWAE